jgi:hypothetical protein
MGDSEAAPETAFPPPSTRQQMMEFLVVEWCHILPIEFQTLVESMSRHSEAVLVVAQHPIKTLYVGVSFILSVTCRSL